MKHRHRRRAAVIALCLAVLAACTRGGEPPEGSASASIESYAQIVAGALETYPQTDASTREVMDASVAHGSMTWEEYRGLSDAYVACLEDLGMMARAFEVSVEGRRDLTHSALVRDHESLSDAEENSTMQSALDHCRDRVWFAANSVYASQPSSMELRAAHIDRFRAPLVECIREAGIDVVDDPTEDELMQAMYEEAETTTSMCALDVGFYEDADIPADWWADGQ